MIFLMLRRVIVGCHAIVNRTWIPLLMACNILAITLSKSCALAATLYLGFSTPPGNPSWIRDIGWQPTTHQDSGRTLSALALTNGTGEAVSPPFRFTSTSSAMVSFYASGSNFSADEVGVVLERVSDNMPVFFLASFYPGSSFSTWDGLWNYEEVGQYYDYDEWGNYVRIPIYDYLPYDPPTDVSEFIQVDELYQLRFRAYDFQNGFVPEMVFGDVQVANARTFRLGDANLDGFVDGADYTTWADNYLQPGRSWTTGDFSRNGKVDGADYTLWADNYSPRPPSSMAVVVPEPASLTLLVLGFGAVLAASSGRSASSGKVRATRNPIAGTALLS